MVSCNTQFEEENCFYPSLPVLQFHLDHIDFLQENAAQREKDDLVEEMKIMQVKPFGILLNHFINVIVAIPIRVVIGLTGSIVASPFENNVYSCCSKPH